MAFRKPKTIRQWKVMLRNYCRRQKLEVVVVKSIPGRRLLIAASTRQNRSPIGIIFTSVVYWQRLRPSQLLMWLNQSVP